MIEFEIRGDVPPLLLNSRMHWREVKAKKIVWYGLTLAAVRKQRPLVPFERALVVYTRHCGHKRPDRDNLVSSFKWIQDALVYAGVLAGDEDHQVDAVHDWQPASPKEKRVAVVIMPIF